MNQTPSTAIASQDAEAYALTPYIARDHQLVPGKSGLWEVVIGLEIHAQMLSYAKLFSRAATAFGAEPNHQVSLVDAAMPGMLPTLNRRCIQQAVKTGLAFEGSVSRRSVFARKNYFYADLPQGYQISQFDRPLIVGGRVLIDGDGDISGGPPEQREEGFYLIRLERIHVEQDAGKSVHDQLPNRTCIDLNRAGVALMEIVTRPDMRSATEAAQVLAKIRTVLRYIKACDGNMQEGSMRADANVSVRRPGGPLGTRAEVKNLNSLRFLRQAIDYEVSRQIHVLESGGVIHQETRLFDIATGQTRTMRSKEDAHDYRYFPDPDLPPLELDESFIKACKEELPELPDSLRKRFRDDLAIPDDAASVLTAEREVAAWFEEAARDANPAQVANWMMSELFGRMNKAGLAIGDVKVFPKNLAKLVNHIASGKLSGKLAKEVFDGMFETGTEPDQIIEAKGLSQIHDEGELVGIIDRLIKDNTKQVEQFRAGKKSVLGWFVGQVMKETRGKANPGIVNKLLAAKLR